MQLKMDSLIAKEFNKLLAIAQDSPQDNYQLKIRVRHNNKFYDYSKKSTTHEIKLEIHDCRKSDNQKPIILSGKAPVFNWRLISCLVFSTMWDQILVLTRILSMLWTSQPLL